MTPGTGPTIVTDRFCRFFQFLKVTGWASWPGRRLDRVQLLQNGHVVAQGLTDLPSPDVTLGENLRFDLAHACPVPPHIDELALRFTFNDGCRIVRSGRGLVGGPTEPLYEVGSASTPEDSLMGRFLKEVHGTAPCSILEFGSRHRDSISPRSHFPDLDYVGVDIRPGENVDIVGDVHVLSTLLPGRAFDAVISLATFEHLLMPWKVALEMNKIMRTGALGYINAACTMGFHDLPCDYWRMSSRSWPSLFNASTGFEILGTRDLWPVHLVPFMLTPDHEAERTAGCTMTEVLIRKIGPTDLGWNVPSGSLATGEYPL